MIERYIKNVFLGFDLFVNAVLAGDPRETISSRIGKKTARGECKLCKFICKYLDKIDSRHCDNSIDWTEGRGSDSDDSLKQ